MHAISGQGSVLPLFFNDMAGVCLYNGHRIIDFTQLSDPPFSGNVQQALATHLCSSHHCRQSWPSAPVDTPPSSILPLNKSTCTQCISLYTATAPIPKLQQHHIVHSEDELWIALCQPASTVHCIAVTNTWMIVIATGTHRDGIDEPSPKDWSLRSPCDLIFRRGFDGGITLPHCPAALFRMNNTCGFVWK